MPEDGPAISYDARSLAESLLGALERSGTGRGQDPVALTAGLELALRAFHLLTLGRLYQVKDQFPATNQSLMSVPEPAIDPPLDALAHPADFLAQIDLLDLLSAEDLPCVAPGLHRGWQDRTRSCQHARRITAGAVGFSIDAEEREELLGALALANRVHCIPPPVTLEAETVRQAHRPVLRLIERLAAGRSDSAFTGLEARILGE